MNTSVLKLCSTYINEMSSLCTNTGCNLLYLMILWWCYANVFRSRNVDQDDFKVYEHLHRGGIKAFVSYDILKTEVAQC